MLNVRSLGFYCAHSTALLDICWNILIKFSKQLGSSFAKIINTKVRLKPCQTSEMEFFAQVVAAFRDELKNLAKHLRCRFLQK